MNIQEYYITQPLTMLIEALPVGTNLALYQFLWMLASGALHNTRPPPPPPIPSIMRPSSSRSSPPSVAASAANSTVRPTLPRNSAPYPPSARSPPLVSPPPVFSVPASHEPHPTPRPARVQKAPRTGTQETTN